MADGTRPINLEWLTSDVDTLTRRLQGIGFRVSRGSRLVFPSLVLTLRKVPGSDDALGFPGSPSKGELTSSSPSPMPRSRPTPPTDDAPHPNGVADLTALGWATVELDRAAGSLAPEVFVPAAADRHLGAYVRISVGRSLRLASAARLAILEPNTEGRLAATLARLGEGPAVLYFEAGPTGIDGVVAMRAAGVAMTAARFGPLGRSVLLPGGPPWGPHVVVSEAGGRRGPDDAAPGTIAQ